MTGRQGQGGGRRTPEKKAELLAKGKQGWIVPDRLVFRHPAEREYFELLMRYRAPDDWHGSDLDRLLMAARQHFEYECAMEILAEEDVVLIDQNGKRYQNPLLQIADRHIARHNEILRGMGLARPGTDRETLAKRREETTIAEKSAKAAAPKSRLLAQPPGLHVVPGGRV